MVFSSTVFLCFFLPLVLILYRVVPKKWRNGLLFVMSLLFYAWGEPIYIGIMLFSTVFDYANGLLIARFRRTQKPLFAKLVLILSVVINLGILGFFKYTDFALETVNSLTDAGFSLLKLALPIGISFYTFQTLSYTIDVYRGNVEAQKNIINFGMYVCLFPQLIAGPIVRYSDIASQVETRADTAAAFETGVQRFLVGLGKKVLLANRFGALWDEVYATGGEVSAATAWLGVLAFTFQIYFDFSGYSDMAIGLGRMFGFSFPENFRYPYEATSITDFWRRWHITLSTWFREYLYIPLGGNRKGPARQVLNLLIVWFLTGLWHGAGWNFILWGLYFFVLLTAEKTFLLKQLSVTPVWVRRLYAFVLVAFGWVLFACDDMAVLPLYLRALFGAFGGADTTSLYYLLNYALLFGIGAVAATHYPAAWWHRIGETLCRKGTAGRRIATVLAVALSAVVLWLCVAFLVGDTYNPFLYFRF